MPVGDEDYSNNLEALGRFNPGAISSGDNSGELDVTLATNLAGEPIRFSMNESLDNIVSSATLTMLNATIGDNGEQIAGVAGQAKTEEDMARWGTTYEAAPIEPNQLVWVTESGGGLGTCTTYWRVVGVTAYLNDEDIPYYDVSLEGYGQIAIETKFDPTKIVVESTMAWFIDRTYYDSLRNKFQVDLDNDGYIDGEVTSGQDTLISPIINGARYIVESPDEYLQPFMDQLNEKGLSCGEAGIPNITSSPLDAKISRGESCWQIIEDILGLNGYIARFTRNKKLVLCDITGDDGWCTTPESKADNGTPIYSQEDIDNPPLEDESIGDFGQGLQLTYSKEGVYSQAIVSGMLVKENESGDYIPDSDTVTEITVNSPAGKNILNGDVIELVVQLDERYTIKSTDELTFYGQKELYKSVMGARSATYDSDKIPLSVEVGMTLSGSSKISGSIEMLITALSRTTDAQQNTITTNISGTKVTTSGSNENTLGWE